MPLSVQNLEIAGLMLVRPQVFRDDRGFFCETYKKFDFSLYDIGPEFVQDNHSYSVRNVLRGLHFQLPPHEQGKLIHVVHGKIWDVVVDIRQGSPSFGKWMGVELSDAESAMLWVPPGFAHGFLTLSKEVHLLYKCTSEYDRASEGGIRWNDPELRIPWPVKDVIVSEKDRALPTLWDARFFQ